MEFSISDHAYKRARKRFKMRDSSLIKAASAAIANGKQLISQDGIYYIHNRIRFVFRNNNLVTVIPDESQTISKKSLKPQSDDEDFLKTR